MLTRAELDRVLREQQARLEARLAAYEGRFAPSSEIPQTLLTHQQFEDELTRFQQEVRYDQARDFRLLLGEISAAEVRAANWIDENRDVLRFALRNNPGLGEH